MFYKTGIEAFGRYLEIFYRNIEGAYEIWLLSESELINHYKSPGNPEAGIIFSNFQSLKWLPAKCPDVIAKTSESNNFKSNRACFDPLYEERLNRKAWNKSKKEIYGTWYDEHVSFNIGPENRFCLNTEIPESHPLSSVSNMNPTFWDYKSWHLSIGGEKGGARFPTLGCIGGNQLAVKMQAKGPIAHVFAKG